MKKILPICLVLSTVTAQYNVIEIGCYLYSLNDDPVTLIFESPIIDYHGTTYDQLIFEGKSRDRTLIIDSIKEEIQIPVVWRINLNYIFHYKRDTLIINPQEVTKFVVVGVFQPILFVDKTSTIDRSGISNTGVTHTVWLKNKNEHQVTLRLESTQYSANGVEVGEQLSDWINIPPKETVKHVMSFIPGHLQLVKKTNLRIEDVYHNF